MRCADCPAENVEGAQFCMQCGARLKVAHTPGPAERRQITVLFCDLVGSTALSEQLDPEDLHDVIRRYHATCELVVARYDGSIAQHLGDGVLVYFGHPHAHEDDATRAVRAALELQRAVSGLTGGGRPLSVRIGIHTGVVVVGEVGAEGRQLALGATPNLAARIQQEAPPGAVLITEASHRLVTGFFRESDLGFRDLRGVTQPVHLYRIQGETGARSRMEATAAGGLTPFIGREKETTFILQRWADAIAGKAAVITLCGEPGIGKSRLVRSLRERVGAVALVIECYASPLFRDTALHPVVEMLERQIGTANESPETRRAKLREQLAQSNLATGATTGPLETLLSIASEDAEAANLSPQKQRQATFDALASWLGALAERQPVLFVLEDAHWADPSTIELMNLFIERLSTARLMMLLTHRPELAPVFASPRVTRVDLQRMPHEEARQILTALATDKPLPEAIEREVLAKADGVPLYLEEIGKAVLESREPGFQGDPSRPVSARGGIAIPATVVDSLTSRLDHLGGGKKVIQLAATIGRTFALGMLLEVAGMQEAALRGDLDRLLAAGLVLRREGPQGESYIFKHALIQDVAYASLLRGTRQDYHRQIARALEDRFPVLAASQPELLARHFEGAGMNDEAVAHWASAGQRALARSANAEAISAFGNALRLLTTLPESEKRDRQEIELRCVLGMALIFTKGWSTKDVEDTFEPAYQLCCRYGDLPARAVYGIWAVYIVRADRERVTQLTPLIERVAAHTQDSQELFIAHGLLAGHAFWIADYEGARHHSEAGARYLDRANPRKQALDLLGHGYDGQLYPLLFRAWSAAIQGRVREAAAASQDAIDFASATEHPFTLGLALCYGAGVAHELGDVQEVGARGRRLSSLAADGGFAWFSVNALSFFGWAALKKGDPDRGIELMKQALSAYEAMGSNIILAYYLSYVAEGCIAAGRIEEGLAVVDRGLRATKEMLAVFCEPELYRLKGELLRLEGDVRGAERSFRTAHALAVGKGALLFEARASLGLGRLWASEGRGMEALPMIEASLARIGDEPLGERLELVEFGQRIGGGSPVG
jgi:class 3 adenylate cyclase